ncbi:MAG: NADPH-dependent F420 reductase [Acidobacteria bacterium]|nr:NADPH-dependent F420 reductase [Acidobacteriota bacterium]
MSQEKIAVIGGTGDLGFGLALRWARAGVQVRIGSREEKKAQEAAERIRETLRTTTLLSESFGLSVEGLQNSQAAAQASMVVLAVPFPAQVGILKSIRHSLRETILVDTTVPLAATLGGKPTRLLGVWQGSAAEQARELVPPAIPVLAAFHHLSAQVLRDLSSSPDCDILVCGDDEEAKQRLFPLVQLIPGLRPIDAGPLEAARIVEGLTALLVSLNRRYGAHHAGIRITGLETPS